MRLQIISPKTTHFRYELRSYFKMPRARLSPLPDITQAFLSSLAAQKKLRGLSYSQLENLSGVTTDHFCASLNSRISPKLSKLCAMYSILYKVPTDPNLFYTRYKELYIKHRPSQIFRRTGIHTKTLWRYSLDDPKEEPNLTTLLKLAEYFREDPQSFFVVNWPEKQTTEPKQSE